MNRPLLRSILLTLIVAWITPCVLAQPAELLLLPEQDDYANLYTNGEAIVQAANGDILAFIVANGQGANPGELYMYRSSDGGATWDARVSVATASPGEPQGIFLPRVVVLPSGRLVMLVSVDFDPIVLASDDNGATWTQVAERPNRFSEAIDISPSGTIVTVDQRDDGVGNIAYWWATSADGETWTPGAEMPEQFFCTTDITALTDIQWVFTYAECAFGTGGTARVYARVSNDAGATWGDEVQLTTAASGFGTLGNMLVQSEGGLMLIYASEFEITYQTGSFADDVFTFGSATQWTVGTQQTGELRPTCASSSYGPACLVRRQTDTSSEKPYHFGVPGVTVDPLLGGTSTEEGSEVPSGLTLSSVYPNPFSGSSTIEYDLERTGDVRLGIYNLLGEEVARLADGVTETGSHAVVWTAKGLPGGVYMIRLSSAGSSVTRPVTLVR